MTSDLLKIFLPAFVSFIVGIGITPFVTHYLYKYQLWKKKSVALTIDGKPAEISSKLHNDEEKKTPRMGGIVIWGSILFTTYFFYFLFQWIPNDTTDALNFFSRNQTWLPFFTLLGGSLIGLVDDFAVVGKFGSYIGGGLSLRLRIFLVSVLGAIGGWWFYTKLEVSTLYVPFFGSINFGMFIIPIFIIVMIGVFSGGIIDGIDGLSGGIMTSIWTAYAIIAGFQGQYDIAAFCLVVAAAILAFLWFNIPPARFYMTETGMLGLTTSLTVVAFLTDAVAVLPIIAFPLLAASLSSILQLFWKRVFGRKLFLVAPIHHHFQALGWPAAKVTMRFWIIGMMCSLLGVIIHIVG